ncbi:restriction endonuclease subunit S [Fusobacterium pseudoperiodonticum]|uniref:restriction endonuclease subunit S n=2 Tax=Fusobacterium TaxID=848 RepID=UPI0028E495BC|nr:restriction endonuclease subunit S [Fusobacterium pseudoperiodonticum]
MKIFNKNEWKKVKLGDICDLRNGVAIKSEDYILNSNTLNCRMSNIRPDGTFDILYNAKYLPDNFSEKYKNYLLKNGDLVIAMTDMAGDPKILGVPTVVKSNGFNIIQNQRVGKLELLTDNIDENYLKFALQSKNVKNYFKKFSAGGVQLNLSKKEILNAPIVLPTIEEQKILVNLFKTIESFIYLRKKELLNLNSLNKSLFTTMFGDIKTNDKNWEIYYWKDILNIKNGKNQKQVEDINGKYPIYGSGGIIGRSNAYICNENSIIIGRKGNINKPILVKEKFWNVDTAFGLEVKSEKMSYHYLYYFCLFYDFEIHNKAVTIPSLVKSDLEKIVLPVPPIELQNKFAERIEKITKLSFEIEEAIKEAENLYNSLISKYFD